MLSDIFHFKFFILIASSRLGVLGFISFHLLSFVTKRTNWIWGETENPDPELQTWLLEQIPENLRVVEITDFEKFDKLIPGIISLIKRFKTIQKLELVFDYTDQVFELMEAIEYLPEFDGSNYSDNEENKENESMQYLF